ncbi:MAG: DMT family transporter [Gammaproteobacteria bacterium]|nr:DMT family transporter [Gammaproteobacteria bacterium]
MAISDWVRLVCLSVLWGGSFFFVEVLLTELPPLTAVLGRLSLGGLGLLAALALLRQPFGPLMTQWRAFAILGLVNTAIPFSLITFGQTLITGSLASIINAMTPIMTVVFAHFLTTDERLTAGKLVGVSAGFAGVVVLIGPDALFGGSSVLGQLAGLTATACYALGTIYAKRLKANPVSLNAAGQVCYSVLWLVPVVLVVEQPWRLAMPSAPVWAAWIGLGFLSTTVALFLFFRVLKGAGASNAALVTFMVPVSASVLGYLFLEERLGSTELLAYVLIVSGLLVIDGRLIERLSKRRRTAHTST